MLLVIRSRCYGDTVLHSACKQTSKTPLSGFKLLIEGCGADVNAQNNDGRTPLDHFFRYESASGIRMDVFEYLFSRSGINITLANNDGNTVLHLACEYAYKVPLVVFKSLVEERGADVNARNENGQTPLHILLEDAETSDVSEDVLEYLLNRPGIDVTLADDDGKTVLHLACEHVSEVSDRVIECSIGKCIYLCFQGE